jgi:structural maintenance of chromosome 3 (chondroitin sulfate proteoglycan 6)
MKSKEGSAKEEKDALTSELQAQTKEKTKLEFTLKDLRDEVAGDSNSKVG